MARRYNANFTDWLIERRWRAIEKEIAEEKEQIEREKRLPEELDVAAKILRRAAKEHPEYAKEYNKQAERMEREAAERRGILYAARKLKVVKKRPGKVAEAAGIPIYAEKVEEGRIYPISPEEVAAMLKRARKEDIKGITSIEFVNPKGMQKEAWGQYVRGKKKILIFSQSRDGCMIDGQPVAMVRRHIKEYVLPHEIGHHRALRGRWTDKSMQMAEARADANVVGLDPFDKDVKLLARKNIERSM